MPAKHFVYSDNANGAPGRLEFVRAFLNSVDLEAVAEGRAEDRLTDWCNTGGFAQKLDPVGLADLASFREALRAVAEANAGEGDRSVAWAGLERFALRARFEGSVAALGIEIVPAGEGADGAIAEILAIVYRAQIDGTWARLKACRKHSCRWAFFDRSKNGSGAWCSMAVCGNRVKAASYRARNA
jgi:hypothetical protein